MTGLQIALALVLSGGALGYLYAISKTLEKIADRLSSIQEEIERLRSK